MHITSTGMVCAVGLNAAAACAAMRAGIVRFEELPYYHTEGEPIIGAMVAFHAFLKGYAPGPRAMACTSAMLGDRAVAVLQRYRR
jgi:hypothetical protein